MKDQLITILEAVRLANAELMTHDTRRVKNAPRTVKRLKEAILFDDRVTRALRSLGQDDEAPSVVPSQDDRQIQVKHTNATVAPLQEKTHSQDAD